MLKNLLNRKLSQEDIRQLFRVIDWLLELPEALSRSFWEEIQAYQEEKKMPVYTSTEKYLINKGRKEGVREATLSGIADWLEQQFGKEGIELMPAIEKINDVKKLRTLQKNLWTATTLAQV